MKLFLGIIRSALLFTSCQKDQGAGPVPLSAETKLNIAYGSDPTQNMDIYLPSGRTTASTKVIILVHGGGWNQGDKSDFTAYVDTLKKRLPGYAVFNINYRLAT